MKLYPFLAGFIAAGVLMNLSLTLANPGPSGTTVPPLPTPTGNSRDLQGLTSPNRPPGVQPRSDRNMPREYQINPNQRPIGPETGIIEWKDQGEPRSGSGGVPLLNF